METQARMEKAQMRWRDHTGGVTLLESLLVLAVVAIIIALSVRYYQSVTLRSAVNRFMLQLNTIHEAMSGLAASTNSYAGITTNDLATALPPNGLKTPWGNVITLPTSEVGYYRLQITRCLPYSACLLLVSVLSSNTHYTMNKGVSLKQYNCTYEWGCSSGATILEYHNEPPP